MCKSPHLRGTQGIEILVASVTSSANPTNQDNLIAASKRFYDNSHYRFTIGTASSTNGGYTHGANRPI